MAPGIKGGSPKLSYSHKDLHKYTELTPWVAGLIIVVFFTFFVLWEGFIIGRHYEREQQKHVGE